MLRRLADKDAIVATIDRLFVATDKRDWPAVRVCFADTVRFDMTSLAGGTPQDLTSEQITSAWDSGLRALEAVHHQSGNHAVNVNGDEANAACYGIAYHYRRTRSGRNTRTFVGSYDFGLRRSPAGWRITAFRFNVKFVEGNLDLEKEESR
jgi:hypothetical protein